MRRAAPIYAERDASTKDAANAVWLGWTAQYVRLTREYHVYVIDAASARSTRILLPLGLGPITAFTCSREDYKAIPARELSALGRVTKRHLRACDMYRKMPWYDHVIVWHDGQQTGATTLDEVRELVDRRITTLGLMVNVAARGNLTHRTFEDDLTTYAQRAGYAVEPARKWVYRQGDNRGIVMWSFWFEMSLAGPAHGSALNPICI